MGALQNYQEQRDDLHADRSPHIESDGLTIADLCNKRHLLDTRDINSSYISGQLPDLRGSCAGV
jgi:hypothetical protein